MENKYLKKFNFLITGDENKNIKSLAEELLLHLDEIDKGFDLFKRETQPLFDEARKKLFFKVGDNPVELELLFDDLISYSFSIGYAVIIAESFEEIYSVLNYCPISKAVTEKDRKLYTEIRTQEQRSIVKKLKLLEDRLTKKISTCQSSLKFESERIKNVK